MSRRETNVTGILTGQTRPVVLILSLLLLASSYARAENLVACLHEDIRATFVKMSYQGGQSADRRAAALHSVLPDPDAFRLVGSVNYLYSVTVGFVTDLPQKDAEAAMTLALLESGYESKQENQRPMRERRGFRRPEPTRPAVRTRLCNSRQDNAHVAIHHTNAGVATMVQFVEGGCRDLYLRKLTGNDGARTYLPELILPPASNHVGGGGGGGSMNSASSTTRFETDQGIGEVYAHFTGQMSDQGWNNDASWSNDTLNGSTWSRILLEGRVKLLGILEIHQSDNRFDASIVVSLYD